MNIIIYLSSIFGAFGQTYYHYDTYNVHYIDYEYPIYQEYPQYDDTLTYFEYPYQHDPTYPEIFYSPPPNIRYIVPFQISYVEFRLYRQSSPLTYTLLTYGSLQTQSTLINLNQPFKLIVHGYLDSTDALWIQGIKNAYLQKGDYNVILVDWRSLSYTFYPITTVYDLDVGNFIGDFIIDLHNTLSVAYTNIHCIGHSMGAHAMGFAGKRVYTLTGSKFSRITGLDPAGPLYLLKPTDKRLTSNDATFVDVIHTDRLKFGYTFSIGNADFYPNGGKGIQPGCPFVEPSPAKVVCDHLRAGYLFAESINTNGFIASSCGGYLQYIFRLCTGNPTALMGENCATTTIGNFYLTTNKNTPFARYGVI